MFKFLKKEESKEAPEVIQSEDWTKDIKRSKKIGQEVEQLSIFEIITGYEWHVKIIEMI